MIAEEFAAWHATYYNDRSIGIELEGCGQGSSCRFPYTQQVSAANLVAEILESHPQIPFPAAFPWQLSELKATPADGNATCDGATVPRMEGLDVAGVVRHRDVQPEHAEYRFVENDVTHRWCAVDKYDPHDAFEWSRFGTRIHSRRSAYDRAHVAVHKVADVGVRLTAAGGSEPAEVLPSCSLGPGPNAQGLINGVLRLDDGDEVEVRDGLTDAEDPECRMCGNQIVEPGETCDDGNADSGDGCSEGCQLENSPPSRAAATSRCGPRRARARRRRASTTAPPTPTATPLR